MDGSDGLRERKVRRPGSSFPRKSPSDGLIEADAPLRCSCCPPSVPPLVKVRSPPSDSHSVSPPSERHSPRGCCTDNPYSAEHLSQPGPHWVAVGLPADRLRQTGLRGLFFPPGGDCEATLRTCERRGKCPSKRGKRMGRASQSSARSAEVGSHPTAAAWLVHPEAFDEAEQASRPAPGKMQ